jgi:hypothetical protein
MSSNEYGQLPPGVGFAEIVEDAQERCALEAVGLAQSPPADAEALARLDTAKELDDARHRVRLAFEKGNATYLYADIDQTMAQAAAQLRASQAREAALREGNDFYAGRYAERCGQLAAASARATALERQLEEARAVIEPFAKAAEHCRIPTAGSAHQWLSWGDYEAARTFLTGEPA